MLSGRNRRREPVERIARTEERSVCVMGSKVLFSVEAMNFALVPKTLIRSSDAIFQSAPGSGWNGDPSNSTTVAPVASTLASQFHIIQPVVVKKNTRSSRLMSV